MGQKSLSSKGRLSHTSSFPLSSTRNPRQLDFMDCPGGGKTRQQLQKRHCQRPHLERVLPFVVVASNPGPSVAKK